MHSSILRTAAALCGAAVVAATLTGCGSDTDSDTAKPTTSSAASAIAPAQADPATTKAITDAYLAFFDGTASPEQRIAAVERGSEFTPVLEAQAGNPQASSTSATVGTVKLIDAGHADVTYTLLIGGNPALPNQAGQAVKNTAGEWKVAAATFCGLLKFQGVTASAC